MKALVLALSFVLTGCVSEARKQELLEQRIAKAATWCQTIGIHRQHPGYYECLSNRYHQQEYQRRMANRAMGQAIQKASQDYATDRRERLKYLPR
jgi:Flp pilus assembly protein TadD